MNTTITATGTFPTDALEARAKTLGWDGVSSVTDFMQQKLIDLLSNFAAADQITTAQQNILIDAFKAQKDAAAAITSQVAQAITVTIE